MIWLTQAFRNIVANGRRSVLVALTVSISALALMLFAGYIHAIDQGIRESTIRGGVGHFQVMGEGGYDGNSDLQLEFGLEPDARAQLTELKSDSSLSIRRIVPRLQFSGLISSGASTMSFSGVGIEPDLENAAFGSFQAFDDGDRLTGRSAIDEVLVGAELARRLNVEVGDSVTLLSTTDEGALNAYDVVIKGTVSTGVPQTELFYLRTTLELAQSLLATDKVSNITFLLDDDTKLAEVLNRVESAVPGIEGRTWRQLSPMYDQIVGMYRGLFYVFSAFIIVITSFGVATIVLTNVMERKAEIGIMRGLGITLSKIRSVFVFEGLLLAVGGLVVGGALSVILAEVITSLRLTTPPPPGRDVSYPIHISVDVATSLIVCCAIFILAGFSALLACNRVAKMSIVESLKGT